MARNLVGKLFLGVMGFGLCVGSNAHARVITDWEASKLTLDALTATPVYHRPVVHHMIARASVHNRYAFTAPHHASVRTVAYRYHQRATPIAAHHSAHHHRT